MKKLVLNFLAIASLALFTVLTSCQKDDEYYNNINVYVVGEYLRDGTWFGAFWKNGVAQNLTDGTRNAIARSVYVSGSDVYVAGYEKYGEGNLFIAKLWKNGVARNLNNADGSQSAHALSVFVTNR